MSESAPPRGCLPLLWRVPLAAGFGVAAVAAVWQGFGLAGFGTDDHPLRNAAAFAPTFAAGLVLFRPRTGWAARALAVGAAVGLACAVWWFVPSDGDGLSLRDAVARRDQLRARLAELPPDDIESGVAVKLQIDRLQYRYRELGRPLDRDLSRWGSAAAAASAARFQQIPLDDVPAAGAFEEQLRKLAKHFPGAGMSVGPAVETWVALATLRRAGELENLPPGDWDAFDRTAPGRRALAEVGPAGFAMVARNALAKAEEEWVTDSVESLIERHAATGAAGGMSGRAYHVIEQDILALQALDAGDDRFKAARRRLFDLAHVSATDEAGRLVKAGRNNAALGVARRHAVEWDATAAVLGARDVKRLDALREKCAALVVPGVDDPDPADEPEVAPPPRVKPR